MKTITAVWGSYTSGLTIEEITTGLNSGKDPLRLYAEKRGLNYGEVIVKKTIIKDGKLQEATK